MMTSNLRKLLAGAVAALGLASSAALAQEVAASRPAESSQMMPRGGMADGNMMAMMSDPEMRGEMMAMMKNCNRMMERMNSMPGSPKRPRVPHEKR